MSFNTTALYCWLFHDFFSFSFFPFFLFVISLKRRHTALLFLFECFSNLFFTKRLSLYQVSVPGTIPSSFIWAWDQQDLAKSHIIDPGGVAELFLKIIIIIIIVMMIMIATNIAFNYH